MFISDAKADVFTDGMSDVTSDAPLRLRPISYL